MGAKVIKVGGRISGMGDSNADRDSETGKYRASHEPHQFVKAVAREGDIATTSDVADRVGCAHRTALMYLNDLEDEGRIESTTAGRAKVWSRSE
jgi:predicted transcriptional regulator of viral defense system